MSKAVGEQFSFQNRSGRYTLHGFANGRVDFLPANAKEHDYRSDEQRAADGAEALRTFEERTVRLSLDERAELLRCSECGGIRPVEWYMAGGSNGDFKGYQSCSCPSAKEVRRLWRQLSRSSKLTRGGSLRSYMLNHDKVGVDI